MFKILSEYYYIDMDAIEEYSRIDGDQSSDDEEDKSEDNQTKVHIVKYETLKFMLEIIMDRPDDIDDRLGLSNSELPLNFKLAFNTLLTKKIINKL
jgi:hypothetical protein